MSDREKVIDAFRNCITEPKCRDCPWDECDTLSNGMVEIPKDLALEVMKLLVVHVPVEPYRDDEGTYTCGACDKSVVGYANWNTLEVERIQKYCSECGQAVKWE